MFRASSAHLQEVSDVNCTCMQPLVFLFSAGGRRFFDIALHYIAKQAKQIFHYKKIKIKLYKNNAAIWFNKTCRIKKATCRE